MSEQVCGSIAEMIANKDAVYEGHLIPYYQALWNDAVNLTNGYHNFSHMLHVTWRCWCACIFHHKEYPGLLSKRHMRNLMIAALFHDFDHCGKQGDDAKNITKAVMALQRHIRPEDKPHEQKIADIIHATKYPYQSDPQTLEEGIIRDADMMQSFLPAWMQQVVFGLAQEWNNPPIKILRAQPAFLKTVRFNTDWGKATISQENIAAKITEAGRLVALLEWQEGEPMP